MENKVIAKEYVESNFVEKYKVIKLKGKIHQYGNKIINILT